jgi:hypothetical protein
MIFWRKIFISYTKSMSQTAGKTRLEDLDIKPYIITKLRMAGIQSIFDLAICIPVN